jgi:hypothetical protein
MSIVPACIPPGISGKYIFSGLKFYMKPKGILAQVEAIVPATYAVLPTTYAGGAPGLPPSY